MYHSRLLLPVVFYTLFIAHFFYLTPSGSWVSTRVSSVVKKHLAQRVHSPASPYADLTPPSTKSTRVISPG